MTSLLVWMVVCWVLEDQKLYIVHVSESSVVICFAGVHIYHIFVGVIIILSSNHSLVFL